MKSQPRVKLWELGDINVDSTKMKTGVKVILGKAQNINVLTMEHYQRKITRYKMSVIGQ